MKNTKPIETNKISQNLFTEQDHEVLRDALPNLDEAERTIIYLRFWANLSEQEIAEAFETETYVISQLLKEACDHLKGGLLANPVFSRSCGAMLAAS